jgi:hypothetical protein
MTGMHLDNQLLPPPVLGNVEEEQTASSYNLNEAYGKVKELLVANFNEEELSKKLQILIRMIKNHNTLRYSFNVSIHRPSSCRHRIQY